VNLNEAKTWLLIYRPGTADAGDPQVAAALALARTNPELGDWLAAHSAAQAAVRAKFQGITPPAGLREQIISEQAAGGKSVAARRTLLLAVAALVVWGLLAIWWVPRSVPPPADNPLAFYQNRMVRLALGGYAMDLTTNDPVPIRAFLAQHHAPADFALPAPLQQAAIIGCAVRDWQGAKVSLVCFRTGRPLARGAQSDLWLFVVDRTAIKNAPGTSAPQVAKVNRLITATWTDGNKLYFLGLDGPEPELRQYL
jgi:hypothetical protein